MTFKLLFEIAFWIVIVSCSLAIIWEVIPEGPKKFWKYQGDLKRDKKKGYHRRYNFSWRIGKSD